MPNHTIRIDLVNNPGFRKQYTSLDIINGVVSLEIKNTQMLVENIKIELEGLSVTSITKKINSVFANEAEIHPLLYDSQMFLPSMQKSDALGSSILDPGFYQFEFSFQVPLNCYCGNPRENKSYSKSNSPSPWSEYLCKNEHISCHLPPTISKGTNKCEDIFEIAYFLKATVIQSSSWDVDPTLIIPIRIASLESCRTNGATENPIHQTLISPFKRELEHTFQDLHNKLLKRFSSSFTHLTSSRLSKKTSPFELKMKVQDNVLQFGSISLPQLSFITKSTPKRSLSSKPYQSCDLEKILLSKFEISLINYVDYKAKTLTDRLSKQISLLNVQDCLELDFTQSKLDQDGFYEYSLKNLLFDNMVIPELSPTFQTCNISNTYKLNIILHINIGSISDNPLIFEYSSGISVSSGIRSNFVSAKEAELFETFNSSIVVSDLSSSYSGKTLLDYL